MKHRIWTLALALLLALSLLAACGGSAPPSADSTAAAPSSTAPSSTAVSSVPPAQSGVASTADAEWKTFLTEYEAWVDDYVALLEKYSEDPTDATLLADYTAMAQEALEWAEKAKQVQDNLPDDAQALAEYLETLQRIADKLAEAQALLT